MSMTGLTTVSSRTTALICSPSATPIKKSPALYGTHGWPETYIIDRTGLLRRKFVGPVDWNSPEVTEFLTKL